MGHGRTVLLVEDHPDLLQLFRDTLTNAGYLVHTAPDGWQALQRIYGIVPEVIVLDLVLPGVHGHTLLRELEFDPHMRDVPVVVVTGTKERPPGHNVRCTLRKPVAPEDLLRAIESCFESPA